MHAWPRQQIQWNFRRIQQFNDSIQVSESKNLLARRVDWTKRNARHRTKRKPQPTFPSSKIIAHIHRTAREKIINKSNRNEREGRICVRSLARLLF
jgi:hypothetical protein